MARIYCRNCKSEYTTQPPKSNELTRVNYCKRCKSQSPFFRKRISSLEGVAIKLKAERDDRSVSVKLETLFAKLTKK